LHPSAARRIEAKDKYHAASVEAKSETRNPKSETNPKSKTQMTETPATEHDGWPGQHRDLLCEAAHPRATAVLSIRGLVFVLSILLLGFGFVSDFVLRI
jgi:hypothetical protein